MRGPIRRVYCWGLMGVSTAQLRKGERMGSGWSSELTSTAVVSQICTTSLTAMAKIRKEEWFKVRRAHFTARHRMEARMVRGPCSAWVLTEQILLCCTISLG